MKYHIFLIYLFLLQLVSPVFSQQTASVVSTKESLIESVNLAPCKSEERLEAVKKLFLQMGAKEEDVTVEKFDQDKLKNVVVRKKGEVAEKVIIGAHYDKIDPGCGAIDNWTGVAIIAHLFKTISQLKTQKSYIFVAFDQEEKGLLGSQAMAKGISKEARSEYCAMVNLDSFGFNAPFSLQNASSNQLVKIAEEIAKSNGMKFHDVNLGGATSDSASFKDKKIPSITFSGLDNKWQEYLHNKNDQLPKINMDSVYLGYRFALAFLVKIDEASCEDLTK